MQMQSRPIDSEFELGGVPLKVVEHKGCEGCFFEGSRCNFPELGACSGDFREDKKPVIFQKIETKQQNT